MPILEKPGDLDSMADGVDQEIYREDVKEYAKDNRATTRSTRKLYSIVLGQCTESLRAKMKGKEDWKKIDNKINSVELLKMIKEILFIVDTGKNIYTKMWKVKREIAELFQNNKTPERYLEKFLRNMQEANQKECDIWLDDGTIMYELKMTKGSNITWDTETSEDI